MKYTHICDECGKTFLDNIDTMEHCANDNGLVVCYPCKKKLKENKTSCFSRDMKIIDPVMFIAIVENCFSSCKIDKLFTY